MTAFIHESVPFTDEPSLFKHECDSFIYERVPFKYESGHSFMNTFRSCMNLSYSYRLLCTKMSGLERKRPACNRREAIKYVIIRAFALNATGTVALQSDIFLIVCAKPFIHKNEISL